MGETVTLFSPSLNGSVSIETRREHLSADTGALVQRELMERSGIIEAPSFPHCAPFPHCAVISALRRHFRMAPSFPHGAATPAWRRHSRMAPPLPHGAVIPALLRHSRGSGNPRHYSAFSVSRVRAPALTAASRHPQLTKLR